MLTTDRLDELIKKDVAFANEKAMPREINQICKRIAFYRTCKLYLETHPKEDYLRDATEKGKILIAKIRTQNKHLFVGNMTRKAMSKAKKDLGITVLEQKNKVLQFLLE